MAEKRLRWFLKPGQINSANGSFGDYYTRVEEYIGANPMTTVAVSSATAVIIGFLFGRNSTSAAPPSVTVPVTITPAHDAPASPATLPAATGGHLTVTTRNKIPGQLRAAAGLDAARLSTVAAGTIVQVLDSKDGTDGKRWYHVQTPAGQTGWMHGEILS